MEISNLFILKNSQILFLFVKICTIPTIYGQNASYGESCSDDSLCDQTQSLKCEKGNCECNSTESMIFDENQRKCVLKVGERCVYKTDSAGVPINSNNPCLTNARCTFGNEDEFLRRPIANFTIWVWCMCDKGYFPGANGICLPQGDIGHPCEDHVHCREDLHLACDLTTAACICNNFTHYNHDLQMCAGRVGESCVENSLCVKNALCLSPDSESSSNKTCQCATGYVATDNGYCLVNYGYPCDHSDPLKQCGSGLVCQENEYETKRSTCRCVHKEHQVFNARANQCVTLVGGPCATDENCIPQSKCIITNPRANGTRRSIGTCECGNGFIEVDRWCHIAYGGECGPQVQRHLKCDQIAPLHCINRKCQCKTQTLQYYDRQSKLCRGLEGSLCSTFSNPYSKSQFCTEGAVCESFRNVSKGEGRCKCLPVYQRSSEGKCY